MNKTLTTELIESELSSKYIGAENFSWKDHAVSFDYKAEIPTDFGRETLIQSINNLTRKLDFLEGKVSAYETTLERVISSVLKAKVLSSI